MRRAIILAAVLLAGAPGLAFADSSSSSSGGRGRLGIIAIGLTDELRQFYGSGKDGVLVGKVEPDSLAARAGVQVGDVLAVVAGKSIDDATDVWPALAGKKKDAPVPLMVLRGHHPLVLTAKLADDVPAPPPGYGEVSTPFGFGNDDATLQQLQQRMDLLEQRMHELDKTH